MRYVKLFDGKVIEYTGARLGGTKWYTAGGWLPYSGTLPVSRLAIEDGAIIELPEPERVIIYSKLKLKRKLAALGLWETLKAALVASGYWEDFELAITLASDDPAFTAALAALPLPEGVDAAAILADCEADNA